MFRGESEKAAKFIEAQDQVLEELAVEKAGEEEENEEPSVSRHEVPVTKETDDCTSAGEEKTVQEDTGTGTETTDREE